MAWVDDRIWCHPKMVGLSKPARWGYVAALAYSSGFQTRGLLSEGQLRTIGITARERRELIEARLWDVAETGISIHDWHEHNSKRDERRAKDRERKRREREADPDSWVIRSGQWVRTRAAVFARDKGICIDCGQETEEWHADHVPDRKTLREQGLDPFDLQFIQTRCQTCHGRRHILERTGKGQKQGQNRGRPGAEGSKGSEGSEGSDVCSSTGAVDVAEQHLDYRKGIALVSSLVEAGLAK